MLDETPQVTWDYDDCMRAAGIDVPESYKKRPIDYIDPAPKPFITQIPLVEYFERVKRLKADKWQHDFCKRLQEATEQRHIKKSWALVHAEAQLGKSSILAQIFAAWLLGHDPLHRFALATYNVSRSQSHSGVVRDILNMPIHQDIFPSKDGWVNPAASKEGWKTNARLDLKTEAALSYNPVGLSSGLTGNNFSTLVIDDPYANEREAFSEATRVALQSFWDSSVNARIDEYSNVFGMFHRFHEQDLAGYLLDKDEGFDYWRYASECDGPYLHEKTGRLFPDPLNRRIGELISERRNEGYYRSKRTNTRVWNSMFQGKPTSDEGDFFKVELIEVINEARGRDEWAKCISVTRAWDHAATDGAGDFTAGALIGIQADGTVIVRDMRLVQFNSAKRAEFQKQIANLDGQDVPICVPEEIGEAGKSLVFFLTEYLQGFSVHPRKVQTGAQITTQGSNAKQRRAYNFSSAVNAGQVKFISDENLAEDRKWNKDVLRALRNFGFTTFDDPVDALGDGYNFVFAQITKGLVIKDFSNKNLQLWDNFKFGKQIPAHWTIYAAIKIAPDSSFANSGVIVARAADNSGLKDTLFTVDEYKEYGTNYEELFTWLDRSLKANCADPKATVIWLHPDSETYVPTVRQKLKYSVRLFEGDDTAGIIEANWYAQALTNGDGKGTRLYGLMRDADSLPAFRQEPAVWGFNDKGEPSKIAQVWDCLRMVTHQFKTRARGLSMEEKIIEAIDPQYRPENLAHLTGQQRETAHYSYITERAKVEKKFKTEGNRHSRNPFDKMEWK